jgi:hypothetical protein
MFMADPSYDSHSVTLARLIAKRVVGMLVDA